MNHFLFRGDNLRSRRARLAKPARSRRLEALERLEDRAVPTVLLDITPAGALTYTEQTAGVRNNLTVSTTGPAGSYSFTDSGSPIVLGPGAVAAGFTVAGATATGPDSAVNAITIDTNDANDTVVISSTDDPTTISPTLGGAETVSAGGPNGLSDVKAPLTVQNSAGQTDLTLNDATDATARTVALSATQLTLSSGSSPITFSPAQIKTLTFNGGTGGNTVNVSGTPGPGVTTIHAGGAGNGSAGNTVNVTAAGLGAGSQLVLDGGPGGNDALNVDTTGETTVNTATPGQVTFAPSTATIRYSGFEQVNINGSPITISPAPAVLNAVEGQPLTNVTVATFTDTNATASASSFTSTIDWGDGSPRSTGLVTQTGGPGSPFTVTGSHTYAESSATPYRVIVTVNDSNDNNATATSSANVADAPLSNGVVVPVSAVEGQAVYNVPVATFTDANPLATVSDFTALVTAGSLFNLGSAAGQQVTITEVGGTAAGANFQVSASFLPSFPSSGRVIPLNVTVTDSGGQTLTPTPGGITVAAAPVTAQGTTITGTEGNPATGIVVTFTSANPQATASDFRVIIDNGDGTTSPGTVFSNGTANGTLFEVNGSHTYAENGTYPVGVSINSTAGAQGFVVGTAVIADAPLSPSATQPVATTTEGQSFSGPVASFTDANPRAPVSDFRALVYFGDGTAPAVGTVSQPGGAGTPFLVSATHTINDSGVNGSAGSSRITVFVNDVGGASVNLTNTATVQDVPITLTGRLNPSSDSGLSSSDGITKVTQPDFFGTSEPFSTVRLLATVQGVAGFTPVQIGAGTTDAGGNWNIVSQPLRDGTYTVTATATDASGHTTGGGTIQTGTGGGPLVIDTVGPKVVDVLFGRLTGQVLVTFQDNLSGLDPMTLREATNYSLTKQGSSAGNFLVNTLDISPGGAPTAPKGVLVTFNTGKSIRGGRYTFTIHSGGIRDVAGNALDGEFFGTFPSGNNIPGGDFVTRLNAIHRRVFAPASVVGNASPNARPGQAPATIFIGGGNAAGRNGRRRIAAVAVHAKAVVVGHTTRPHAHDLAIAHIQVPKARRRA